MPTQKTTTTNKAKTTSKKKLTPKETAIMVGVGTDYFTCYVCGEIKPKREYYQSSDPRVKTGVVRVCKQCCTDIALQKDEYGDYHEPTKQSVMEALEYIDKPFLETVWDASIVESQNINTGKTRGDVWKAYVKNIAMPQYATMRWRDSDTFKRVYRAYELGKPQDIKDETDKSSNNEIMNSYITNKKDVIRLIGYDPFANYPREDEKPILYAQLVSFIDEETKNDGMKMGAVIQIVKKLNQAEKLNDQIDMYINDVQNAASNMPLIDKMASSSQKLMTVANTLAKDNGISVNFNNNKSKGANTLSGKIKKLTAIGLREAKINTFDVGTCEGMKQVAMISEEARHAQIGYDENIAAEIKDIKVQLVEQLTKERDQAVESARLLLVENKDLKSYMIEKGLLDEKGQVVE